MDASRRKTEGVGFESTMEIRKMRDGPTDVEMA